MNTTTSAESSLETLRDQLEPVRLALLDDAMARAAEIRAGAESDAAAIIAEATVASQDEVDRVRERAENAERERSRQGLDRARSDAHQQILRARAALRSQLTTETRQAFSELAEDPRYPELLDHLTSLARDQLAPDAVIERDPEGLGGIVAHSGGRRVDYTLEALAERSLERLGDDIERL